MSEQAGRLDGLQAMIEPLAPAAEAIPVWLYVLLACVLFVLMFFFYWRYSRQSSVIARKQFRRLKAGLNRFNASQVGESLEKILQLTLGQSNIYAQASGDIPSGLSPAEWHQLLSGCAQLRYSRQGLDKQEQIQLLSIAQKLLGGTA